MKEIWKTIKGYKNYHVSNKGNIKSHSTKYKGKLLKPQILRKGYLLVYLYKNKIRKGFQIHRLVLQTFRTTNNKKLQCNHKDGNKQNNKLNNLEWMTCKENIKHAIKNKLHKMPPNLIGEKCSWAKLTENKLRAFVNYIL